MLVNFAVVQIVPGGPVERVLAQLDKTAVSATARMSGGGGETLGAPAPPGSAGASSSAIAARRGSIPSSSAAREAVRSRSAAWKRFVLMMGNYLRFDFGNSYFRDQSVASLVLEKLPVSISLGIWTTLLVYLISIPLGIAKAVRDGSRFDVWTSGVVIAGNAVPSFLFAILLSCSSRAAATSTGSRCAASSPRTGASCPGPRAIADYLWHMALPVTAMVIGGFASLTILTKNSFLEEIHKQYVVTARAKGLDEQRVLYGHVFRNAMLIVIAGFPAAFIGVLFTRRAADRGDLLARRARACSASKPRSTATTR